MMWESWYWRSDLTKFAASLRKRENQKRWSDSSLARCEQTIMVGFFYVRKLIESRKLSRDFADRNIGVISYPATGEHVHGMNFPRDPADVFDMVEPNQTSIKIEDLANQLIHSYVFWLSTDDAGLKGILVASDRIRNRELLEIAVRDILAIFDFAAKGEADKAKSWIYDHKKNDYVVRLVPAGKTGRFSN